MSGIHWRLFSWDGEAKVMVKAMVKVKPKGKKNNYLFWQSLVFARPDLWHSFAVVLSTRLPIQVY
jgi:hypothetical protein